MSPTSFKSLKLANADPESDLEVVPESTAPDGLEETVMVPTKSVTGLPETSWTVTAGWVVNSSRFTAPVAEVETTSWVASPKLRATERVAVSETGLVMLALSDLEPVRPMNLSPGKLTSPEAKFRTAVPEIVASEILKVMVGVPVVTRLPSASLSLTTTSVDIVRELSAVDGAISSRVVAVPCAKLMLWVASVSPVEVYVRV
jgi:hypothetical protein